jgi:hypothetical protein
MIIEPAAAGHPAFGELVLDHPGLLEHLADGLTEAGDSAPG